MKNTKKSAGFTILEFTMATAAFLVVLGGATYVALVGTDTVETGMASHHLSARMRQTIEKVADAVHDARSESLNPNPAAPLGSSTLEFQVLEDVVDGSPVWGDTIRVDFQYVTGEADNGLDDNGDGLIDEGMVVWTENPGTPEEWSNTLVRGVAEFYEGEIENGEDDNGNGLIDERGLSFELDTNTLTIRLCLASNGEGGTIHLDTAETAVRLHN